MPSQPRTSAEPEKNPLLDWRQRTSQSQAQAARRLGIKHAQHYQLIERGTTFPRLKILAAMRRIDVQLFRAFVLWFWERAIQGDRS